MNSDQPRLKYEELTERIIGVFYDVYNEVGFGFLESVYEKCFVAALREVSLAVEQQVSIPFFFRGQPLAEFSADVLVNRRVLVEIKACKTLDRSHEAQLLNYLRATEIEIGLLLNFGNVRRSGD
jgi:GxxExxY protein